MVRIVDLSVTIENNMPAHNNMPGEFRFQAVPLKFSRESGSSVRVPAFVD